MEESAKLYCDKSWFQFDAHCKTFPQDMRNGKNWSAGMKRANRVERRQQLWMMTSRQLHSKPLFRGELEQHLAMNHARLITYEQVRSEIQAYIEASRSQFAHKTVVSKITSDPMEVDSFGKECKKRKGDGKNVKKEGQHQNQGPNPIKDAVCWHCSKKGHLSTLVESTESVQSFKK